MVSEADVALVSGDKLPWKDTLLVDFFIESVHVEHLVRPRGQGDLEECALGFVVEFEHLGVDGIACKLVDGLFIILYFFLFFVKVDSLEQLIYFFHAPKSFIRYFFL